MTGILAGGIRSTIAAIYLSIEIDVVVVVVVAGHRRKSKGCSHRKAVKLKQIPHFKLLYPRVKSLAKTKSGSLDVS